MVRDVVVGVVRGVGVSLVITVVWWLASEWCGGLVVKVTSG